MIYIYASIHIYMYKGEYNVDERVEGGVEDGRVNIH